MTNPARLLGLGLTVALSTACGRGDGFGDGFSVVGGGGTPSGTGRSGGSSGPGSSGGQSGGTFGAGTAGNGPAGIGTGTKNGASTGRNSSGSGGAGASGGFTTGIGNGATNGKATAGATGGSSAGGSNNGGTGGSNNGGTGGSGGTGSAEDGGDPCAGRGNAGVLAACQVDDDCACKLVCVDDPAEGQVCESPCAQTSDCPSLATFCNGTSCQVNTCGGDSGNGSFNSFCNVVGVDDGTCSPFLDIDSGVLIGICTQGGSATVCCDPSADHEDIANACVAGMVCIGGGLGQGGVCGDVCDPFGSIACPVNQQCASTVDDPAAGACFSFPGPQCD